MARKKIALVPLAAALAALTPLGNEAKAALAPALPNAASEAENSIAGRSDVPLPNHFVSIGKDLLGFSVTTKPNGVVLADHYSHASHASHASHYSSRY